jgi:hypothetical protein
MDGAVRRDVYVTDKFAGCATEIGGPVHLSCGGIQFGDKPVLRTIGRVFCRRTVSAETLLQRSSRRIEVTTCAPGDIDAALVVNLYRIGAVVVDAADPGRPDQLDTRINLADFERI